MTSIQIYNPQGYAYEANWNGGISFPITDSCERIANVMGEDCVRLVFNLPNKVVFDAFAYIVYNGQTFFLKEQYIPTPDGTFKEDNGEISTAYFSYDVKFVSVGNMLDKFICYRHVKVTNVGEWDEPEININGNLETLYVIIMGSIQQASNRLKAQYGQLYFADLLDTIVANGLDGNMPNTENVKLTANTNLLTFNFSGDNIANVCTTVANSFTNDDKKDTEWYIVESNGSLTLHFAKCVDVEYGVQYVSDYISNNNSADSFARPQKSGGLKKVEYSQAWSGITNVIVPYGSTRNMSYQAAKGIDEITQMQSTFGKRLRLTPNTSYNVKDKEGNEVIITTDSHGAIRNNYVDTGIEQVKFYDEIYPQGHFRVTSVETKNKRQDGEIVPEYTVSGIAIDSKGNEIQPAEGFYPIVIEEGTTLSVRFEKGLLNGREFEIANKTRKDEGATTYSLKFTIVADGSIEDGTLIPSGNFIPREGDEFALFNMKMPEVYITAAKQELAQRAYDELVELQTSRPQVKCTTDPTAWDKPIALGYQFKVMSELFNSEDSFISRVTSYSYKLTKPYDVQFTLASAIMQGTLSQMNDLISDVTHQAGGLEQRAINLSRRGWRDAAEMAEMVDSLAADMMLVGNEKYQFAFTAGIEIVNSNNQTTAIKIGEGTLQHTQDPYISDYTCQGWWSHGAVTLNNGHTENGSAALTSVPDTPFYLYAVVGQNSTDISFELQDQEQNDESYLLLGIMSSAFTDTIDGVTTNYRVFNRTNGYTQISGGTITTEQIQDAGRNLIIDFQSNPPRIIARNGAEIIGNIKFKASDEKTAEEQLAALGIDVGKAAQAAEDAKNMEIGVRNLWAKKYMMDWNDTYAGCATKGSDEYGEYIQIKESDIWTNIANRNQTTDIFNGKITFEPNKQYYFKAKWRNASSTPSTYGVSFRFVYTDGTVELFGVYCNSAEPIVVAKASNPNKSVKNIGFDYSSSTARTRIYEIQLVQATKQPNDWLVAPEDVDAAIAESTGYVDIYTGGNKSHNYLQGDSAQILHLCNISSNAAYITSVNEDNGSGGSMIDPFGGSCLIAWDKGAGFPVNYYEIFDFGINNVYGVYRWGDTINCPKDAQLLVCLAQYDYISYSVKNNDMQSIEYPRNGTWTLNDIKVYTNNALIAQAAMYKAEGLDYLKTALEDGSTEIAGGLTMTNVLMLKNLAGGVTAGMSGLTKHNNKEDKVLMWGGGTYEEAYAAANNNTYNTGSGTITTLLKKDGTGKIGAFQIDKDTIKVVTNTQTTYITNKSIENAVGLQSTYDKAATKTTDSNSINSGEGGSKSATYPSGGSKVIHTQTFYNVAAGKYLLTGEFTINSMSVGTTPVDPPSYAYSSLDLQNLYIEVWQNSKKVGYLYGNPNRQIVYEKTYQSEGNEEVLENSDTGYRGGFIQPSNGNASKTITLSAGTITIRAVAEYDAYLETEGLASASYYIDFRYLYHLQGIEKYTVIANDGIAVISNSDSQFYINNDSDSLNVKMRGLPTSSTGLVKGDLYTSSGYLRIVT